MRFCGKLWTWIVWFKDQITMYIRKRQGYTTLGDTENPTNEYLLPDQSTQTPTFLESVKTQCKKVYNGAYKWFFGRYPNVTQPVLPLHESQRESFVMRAPTQERRDAAATRLEEELFDKQLRELCSNDSVLFDRNYQPQSSMFPNTPIYSSQNNLRNTSIFPAFRQVPTSASVESRQFESVCLEPVPSGNSVYDTLSNIRYDPLLHSSIFNPLPDDEDDHHPNHNFGSDVNSSALFDSRFIAKTLGFNNTNATSTLADDLSGRNLPFAQRISKIDSIEVQETQDSPSVHPLTSNNTPPINIIRPPYNVRTLMKDRVSLLSQSVRAEGRFVQPIQEENLESEVEKNPYI